MEAVSRVVSREIPIAIFGTTLGGMSRTTSTIISRVVAEIKSMKVEEGNQQFENECIECNKV